jgi:hypothetical protein
VRPSAWAMPKSSTLTSSISVSITFLGLRVRPSCPPGAPSPRPAPEQSVGGLEDLGAASASEEADERRP